MPEQSHPQLGWIGLGSMGLAMALNIQKHQHAQQKPALRFYNRTAAKGRPLAEHGGVQSASISQLMEDCDLIFISSSDDAALKSILDKVLEARDLTGKVIVDTTTVHPDTTATVAEQLKAHGALFAAAPVFGAGPVAESGKLLIAFAGPDAAFEIAAPYLKDVIGREVLQVAKAPEKGTLLKTCGNFIIAGIMELIAESHVFAEKTGLGSDVLERLIELNFGPLAHSDSQRMTKGVYKPASGEAPWSDIDLALKDVGHGVRCAENAGARLRVGELVLDHLKQAKAYSVANGGCALDSSSMYGVVRQEAGLDFESELIKSRDASL